MGDRQVHARATDGGEVVRYDREGRWYFEQPDTKRRRLSAHDAAAIAREIRRNGGEVFLGLPGGNAFDYKVTRGGRD